MFRLSDEAWRDRTTSSAGQQGGGGGIKHSHGRNKGRHRGGRITGHADAKRVKNDNETAPRAMFLHRDHLATVRLVTRDGASIEERSSFSPDGDHARSAAASERDDPETGRFASKDRTEVSRVSGRRACVKSSVEPQS